MKLDKLMKQTFKPSLGEGTHVVKFERIEWIEDDHDEVTAYRIHIEGYNALYNKLFEDFESNFALKAFMDQLGETDLSKINNHKGENLTIEMKRSADGRYINANFRIKGATKYR